MRELVEFRVDEDFASLLFADDEGKKLGDSVRKIELATDDPRFCRVGELQREIDSTLGRSFFHGWNIRHKYSKPELEQAELFTLINTSFFEPAGEECGTVYDDTAACDHVFARIPETEICGHRVPESFDTCGVGARQTTPLYLPEKRIPKRKDVSQTIAGETVVSQRVKELFATHGITGAVFSPIRSKPSSNVESTNWFQLTVPNANASIAAPTRVGEGPFDDDEQGRYRCPQGHVIGLNLLSEVSVTSASRGDMDIVATRQFIGVRRGLLRPERIVLVSPKVRRLIETEKLKGVVVEVAHIV